MIARKIQSKLFEALWKQKIIIMTWARQVWKTTLLFLCRDYLLWHNETVTYLTLDDPLLRKNLDTHPEQLFQYIPNKTVLQYVLIDEIQYLKDPTWFLKYHFDLHKERIRLVVTWSSSFYIDTKFRDSLAWRKLLFPIYPLSFIEFLEFKGVDHAVFMSAAEWSYPAKQEILRWWYEYALYWWYPECVLLPWWDEKREYLKQLIQTYVSKDVHEAGVQFHDKYLRLMKVMAMQVGNLVNKLEVANTLDMSAPLVADYLYVMQKSYHLAFIRPFFWNNIRNEITKMPKVYFYDCGLRNALVNNWEPLIERIDAGALLENVFFQQLIAKYDVDDIHFWRSKQKQEVDFVINGSYAFEIKMNKDKFMSKQYTPFITKYPKIPLIPKDFLDILLTQ